MSKKAPVLPPHIEDTVATTAEMHARHYRDASALQRFVAGLTAVLARPAAVGVVTAAIAVWVGLNLWLPHVQLAPLDRAPFFWMQGLISTTALYITILILITQRHENVLSEHRAQLTLQLAMVNEQKTAKLIELIERMSRDNPLIEHRFDAEATAMAQPADPQAMIEAIKEAHDDVHQGENAPRGR